MSSQSWSGLDGTVNCRSCWAQNRRHTHTHLRVQFAINKCYLGIRFHVLHIVELRYDQNRHIARARWDLQRRCTNNNTHYRSHDTSLQYLQCR
ncbi:hypothetical protein [Banggai cardinalfish iridovirus]|uniref:Uncharacterized protein n=1 Tax=Banggai cardinalfish iridovirus TaxID=565290 RepID=A0A6M3QSZ8_ISKNV|nr:hypothetical protein [Banggai cardinalfish iridovirus]